MGAYEGNQVTVAGAVGTVADVDSSNAVRIGDVAYDSREVLDFVRYVPGGGMAVSHSICRHRNRASAGTPRVGGSSRRASATRPAQDAKTLRMAARISAVAGFIESVEALLLGSFRITRTTFGLALVLQSECSAGSFSMLFYQMIPTRHAQESAIGGPARIFPGASVPSTST